MAVEVAWVHVQAPQGRPSPSSLELLSAAGGLADRVVAFGTAEEVEPAAALLGQHGAGAVYSVDCSMDVMAAAPMAAALAQALELGEAAPQVILFSTSADGRDVSGRLSVRLDRPLLANVESIAVEGGTVVAQTSIFGGTTLVRTAFRCPPPWLVTVRPKSYAARQPAEAAPPPEVVPLPVPDGPGPAQGPPRIVARHVDVREGPTLDEATVVVAGGRGLGSAEAFARMLELARLLNAAPGASRAAVDAGWAPYAWQVGQTGKSVTPTVYLAFGISGAVHHAVGIRGAKHVIAVNQDRLAPILALSDLGVVGDTGRVLPRLIEALRARGLGGR